MRDNERTVLVGSKCVLVPYRKQHVARYHAWMSSAELRAQTASEPLSLDEEHAMQASWRADPDKLTFIVLARGEQDEDAPRGEGSADAEARTGASKQVDEAWLQALPMCGDVNVFFSPADEDEDEEEEAENGADASQRATATAAVSALRQPVLDAECELMIADSRFRRRGIGREALLLLLAYVRRTPGLSVYSPASSAAPSSAPSALPSQAQAAASAETGQAPRAHLRFLAKIGLENSASLALFHALGFRTVRTSEVWQEAELRVDVAEGAATLDRLIDEVLAPSGGELDVREWPLGPQDEM